MSNETERKQLEQSLGVPPLARLPSIPPQLHMATASSTSSSPISLSSQISTACAIVGRNVVCDVRFDHKSISRKHAVIYEIEGKGLVLRDLGGKKGIFVNGARIEAEGEVVLKNGDNVKFGNMEEVFKLSYTAPPPPPPSAAEEEEEEEEVQSAPAKPPEPVKPARPDTSNMTARQIRELEIKEMMESFDQEQTYEKYQKPQEEEEEEVEKEEEKEEEGGMEAEVRIDGSKHDNY